MMHKGDIGTVIILDTGVDLSGAVSSSIKYKKPNGTTGEWTATTSTTEIRYTTLAGDIDQAGDWELQGYVDLGSWEGRSSVVSTTVGEQI
jgi:hypothetical protein